MIQKAEERAIAAYVKDNPAPAAPAEEPPAVEPPAEPPAPTETPEAILQAQELERLRAENAALAAANEQAAAERLKAETMDKIAALVAKDPDVIADPAAHRALTAEIYASGNYTYEGGELTPKDLTAKPEQIVSEHIAERHWYKKKLPETGPPATSPGRNGAPPAANSGTFDPSQYGTDFFSASHALNRKG
jgi:hypothetical protein